MNAFIKESFAHAKDWHIDMPVIKPLPGLRISTYLSNCEKKRNEYCDKPATAKMPHYYPSQGLQNQDLGEVKEEEPQVGIEHIQGL